MTRVRLKHTDLSAQEPGPTNRESILPMILGLVVALVVCIVVVPTTAAAWLASHLVPGQDQPRQVQLQQPRKDRKAPPKPLPEPQQRLGDDEPNSARVAWISYDDYRQLMAPKDRTEQPALQQTAAPVKDAPHRLLSAPPVPAVRDAQPAPRPTRAKKEEASKTATAMAKPTPPAPPAKTVESAGRQQPPVPKLDPRKDGTIAVAETGPKPVPAPKPGKTAGPPRDKPSKAGKPKTTTKTARAAPKSPKAKAGKPTASPRSDREASPVSLQTDSKTVVAGRVVTGRGVKIKTVAPRIGSVTLLTAARSGLRVPVRVYFDKKGRVTKANLKRSTGYPQVDTPIRASLYQWKASGKQLAKMKRPFVIVINLDIGVRR